MLLYPAYIDSSLSKREGRKISRRHAVDSPKVQEIGKALETLEIGGAVLEKDSSYPRRAWESEGRVVLELKGGKTGLLRKIAKEIRRMRASS